MKGLIRKYRYIWGTSVAIAALLFSAPGAFAQQNQDEILLEAAQRGDIEAVKASLANGAKANAQDESGATALICSAAAGNIAVVQALIEGGADVNSKDSQGITALMHAAFYNNIDIVKLLLSKGAQVDAEDNTRSTAWVMATERGYVEVANVLREAKAAERFDALGWSGAYSDTKELKELIITDAFRWKKTWANLGFEASPPVIDFNTYFIAGVFLGVRPTGGYAVSFGTPYQEEGKTVIPYEEIKPGPREFVTQALTQPYAMKVFEKKTEAAICREVKKNNDESK